MTNGANIAAALASAAIATFYATAYIASVAYGLIPEFRLRRDGGGDGGRHRHRARLRAGRGAGRAARRLLTPGLFDSEKPSIAILFAYLTLLHVAAFAVIRLRTGGG